MTKKISKLMRLAFVALMFFATLELCARLDDYFSYAAPILESYSNHRLRTNDEEGIRKNIPNSRYEKWENNSLGFRGPEILLAKSPGVKRVVCLGASETYGLYESAGQEWPAQLASLLSGDEFEIVNVATVGLQRDEVARYYQKYVERLDPDIVILIPGAVSIPKAEKKAVKVNTVRSPVSEANIFAVHFDSRIVPKAWQVTKAFVPDVFLEKYQLWSRTQELQQGELRWLKGEKPWDDFPQTVVDDYRADYLHVIEVIQASGTELILSSAPTLFSVENIDQFPLVFLESRRQNVRLSNLGLVRSQSRSHNVMQDLARKNGLRFVDCARVVPANLECFADAVHLTDQGAGLVAAAFAAALRQNP